MCPTQDYGSTSNYSTLRTSQDEYDYTTLDRDTLPLSEEELEKYVDLSDIP